MLHLDTMTEIAISVRAPCSSCEKKLIYLVVLLYVATYILTVLWKGCTVMMSFVNEGASYLLSFNAELLCFDRIGGWLEH